MCLRYFVLSSISNILLILNIYFIFMSVGGDLVSIFFLLGVASCGFRVHCMGTICNNFIFYLIFTTFSIITIPSILTFYTFSIIGFLSHFCFFFHLLFSSLFLYLVITSLFYLNLQEFSHSIFFCFLFHFYEASLNHQSALRLQAND